MVMKKPLSMFGTAPQFFGRQGEVVLGKKSGKASINYQLEKFGIENISDEQVGEILAEVKTRGAEKKSLLTDEEFKEIVRQKIG
jgi:methanogen homocitrate synthase